MDRTNRAEGTEDVMREVEALVARRQAGAEAENRRLQRQVRMLAVALAGVVAVFSALFLVSLARTQPGRVMDSVAARNFVLRDADGMPRAELRAADDGAPQLVMRDRDGRERVRLVLLSDGSPGLTFADRDERPRAVLGLLPDETSNLVFADRSGRTRAVFGLSAEAASTLVFADGEGETRVGLGVDSFGDPDFTLVERAAPAPPAPADSVAPAPGAEAEAGAEGSAEQP